MQLSKMVSIIKQRLARFNGTALDNYVVEEIAAAKERLEEDASLKPWFLKKMGEDLGTLPFEASSFALPPTANFWTELENAPLRLWDGAAMYRLGKPQDGVVEFSSLKTAACPVAQPQFYKILNRETVLLNCRADKAYTMVGSFYALDNATEYPSVLTGNEMFEGAWMKYVPELVIAEAGIVLCKLYVKREDAVQFFLQGRVEADRRLLVANTEHDDTNTLYMEQN